MSQESLKGQAMDKQAGVQINDHRNLRVFVSFTFRNMKVKGVITFTELACKFIDIPS